MVVSGAAFLVRGQELTPGALYVTTRRILFEAGAGGANPFTAYQEGMEGIWNVHHGAESKFLQGRREFLTVEGSRGRFVFQVPNARAWADTLVTTRTRFADSPPPPPPPSSHPPPPPPPFSGQGGIILNVHAPAAPTVMMHCRHCGNLYDATKGRCDKCGAPPT